MKAFQIAALLCGLFILSNCQPKTDTPAPTPAPVPTGDMQVQFNALGNGEPFQMNQRVYTTALGETFETRSLQVYLSNVSLVNAAGEETKAIDSYHLVRVSASNNQPFLTSNCLKPGTYNKLRFYIGLDSVANYTIDMVGKGDLSLNDGMVWSWNSGYKFIIFEGSGLVGDTVANYIVHTGFMPNYRLVEVDLPTPIVISTNSTPTIQLDWEVSKIFTSVHNLSIGGLGDAMHNTPVSRQVADNYETMFSLKSVFNP